MSKPQLSFYTTKVRTLLSIVFFCLFLITLEIILWFTANDLFSELYSLAKCSYEYSVLMNEPVGINDYYQFNAAIRFSTSSDSDIALKADVIMQIDSSEYNNDLCWNTSILKSDGIAITQSIARANGISVGDKLYSKHIVDGNIHEYTVMEVLPNIVDARYTEDISHNTGVIVMAYDSLYEENISHNIIIFTKESINELIQNNKRSAIDILYRKTEIVSVIKDLLPYALFFVFLRVICSIGFVTLRTKELSANYKRYIILGYQPDIINKAYNQKIVLMGCLIEVTILTVNIILEISHILCLPEVLLVVSSQLLEIIVIIATAHILKKRLWRS